MKRGPEKFSSHLWVPGHCPVNSCPLLTWLVEAAHVWYTLESYTHHGCGSLSHFFLSGPCVDATKDITSTTIMSYFPRWRNLLETVSQREFFSPPRFFCEGFWCHSKEVISIVVNLSGIQCPKMRSTRHHGFPRIWSTWNLRLVGNCKIKFVYLIFFWKGEEPEEGGNWEERGEEWCQRRERSGCEGERKGGKRKWVNKKKKEKIINVWDFEVKTQINYINRINDWIKPVNDQLVVRTSNQCCWNITKHYLILEMRVQAFLLGNLKHLTRKSFFSILNRMGLLLVVSFPVLWSTEM